MVEREDWFADTEGNLTPPDDPLKPATDEFGRDDPASLERERRRRERELRRRKSGASADGASPDAPEAKPKPPPRKAKPTASKAPPRARRARRRPTAAPPTVAPSTTPPESESPSFLRRLRGRFGGGGGDRPARPGNYRRRRIIALGVTLVGLLFVWFLVALFQPFAGDGEGNGQVIVTIPEGATAGEIADILTENDVVTNGTLFQLRLRLAGKTESVGAGRFVLASGMSYGTAIDRLTETGGKVTLTLPEGLPRDQMAPIIADAGVSGDYLAATQAPPKGFNPAQYGAASPNLEGFLFPATYELEPNAPVEELVNQQLEAFEQNFGSVDLSYAKKKNLTPYDVLIIASMVDREVQVPKERPLVAAVIYNRLKQGMPLGIDATTRYETKNYTEPILQSTFDKDTPYNTRLNAGLTPTPIGNPGLDAIKAAANPAKVNYLYFVVKPGTCGEHTFTASEAEFTRLSNEYQQALQEQGGSPTEC
jgi:UPF0755 protein